MMLTLKVLNSDASLNNFTDIGNAQIIRNSDAKLILQLQQVERDLRYMPAVGAVMTVVLLKSDGTTVFKTASQPFSADDRSIIEFDLSASDTALMIGQNLIIQVVEGSVTSFAFLKFGLQMVPTASDC